MRVAALLFVGSLLGGCVFFGGDNDRDDSCEMQACTALFATVGVSLVNSGGQPVTGMTTQTILTATGAVVHTSSANDYGYVVIDDNLDRTELPDGERHEVQFTAQGAAGSASANFVIKAGECVCHVEKLIGPESIVVQP
jgi:hypothetical protein